MVDACCLSMVSAIPCTSLPYMTALVPAPLVISLVLVPSLRSCHILQTFSLEPPSLFLAIVVDLLLPPLAPVPSSLAVLVGFTFLVWDRFAIFLAAAVLEATTTDLATETTRPSWFSKMSTIRSTAFASRLAISYVNLWWR